MVTLCRTTAVMPYLVTVVFSDRLAGCSSLTGLARIMDSVSDQEISGVCLDILEGRVGKERGLPSDLPTSVSMCCLVVYMLVAR